MLNESLLEGLSFFSPVENSEPYFDKSSCDACNSSLGGNRYDVNCRLNGASGEIITIAVCEDCFVELCS